LDRIPILKMGEFLLVTIQVDMHDQMALALQDDLTEKIVQTTARGVLIDISSLEMVDSFIGRMLGTSPPCHESWMRKPSLSACGLLSPSLS
jgi:rsbT antagonist protein RsbS